MISTMWSASHTLYVTWAREQERGGHDGLQPSVVVAILCEVDRLWKTQKSETSRTL